MEQNSAPTPERDYELLELSLSSFITYTNTVTKSPTSKEQARAIKFKLLELLKGVSSLYGLNNCSNEIRIWNPGHETDQQIIRKPCNNRHACPLCTSKYMAKKREELIRLMVAQRKGGGDVCTSVLTQAIPAGQYAPISYGQLLGAWSEMGKSAAFRKLQKLYQVVGYARIMEETHLPKGWFPHFHCVWFFETQPSEATMTAFGLELAQLWAKFSNAAGAKGTLAANQCLDFVDEGSERSQANYLFKHGFFDVTFDPEGVAGKQIELKPFELLEVAFVTADADLIQSWLDFETAVSGTRRVVFSRYLIDQL